MDYGLITEEVRLRVVKAAETERRLPGSVRPSQMRTVWPDIEPPSFLEVVEFGYTREELEEQERERNSVQVRDRRTPAKPAEVTEMMEVLEWIARHVVSVERRHSLLAWARGKASQRFGGESFRGWCRRKGVHHKTADRRASAAVEDISKAFANKRELLPQSVVRGVSTRGPDFDTQFGTLARVDGDEPGRSPSAWMAPDAKPVAHDEGDPDSVAATARGVEAARRNARRRNERRRAKPETTS